MEGRVGERGAVPHRHDRAHRGRGKRRPPATERGCGCGCAVTAALPAGGPGGARGARGGSDRPVRLVVPGAGSARRRVPPTDERRSPGVDRLPGFSHSRYFRAVRKLRGCPPPSRRRADAAVDVAQVARPVQPDQASASRQAQSVGRQSGARGAVYDPVSIDCCMGLPPGAPRPGTAPGEESISRPRVRRTPAVP